MTRMLRQDAHRLLADVPEQHVFRCSDGRVLRNMRQLEQALASMRDEAFAFHSNTEKSDFSNWVRDVIGDEKLARDLDKARNPIQAAKSVTKRIGFLESRLS